MEKFLIPPDEEGYSFSKGQEVIAIALKGGISSYRKDIKNASSRLSVQWTLDREGYKYFNLFFGLSINNGADPFLIDLLMDSYELTEHVVYFIPGTRKLAKTSGFTFIVEAELEVRMNQPTTNDNMYLEAYKRLGNGVFYYEDLFNTTINHKFPNL